MNSIEAKKLADQMIFGVLKDNPKSTALEIFNKLKPTVKNKGSLKAALPESDQTIRERLRVAEKNGYVLGEVRQKTVLTEWSLTEEGHQP
jgi:DNA-binding HxlR family transcriptional regulator